MTARPLTPAVVKRRLDALNRQLAAEIIRHEAEKLRIRTEVKAIQGRCQHTKTTEYRDPAGGSDSSTECDICGKEV